MASRIPRRTFAAPFVITLAAGCYTQAPPPAQPPPANPPPPTQPDPVVANPPRPEPDPGPTQSPPMNPPAPQRPPMNPPAPQTNAAEWTVTKQGAICTAAIKVTCPPAAMCNPPGPHPVDCLPYMADMADGATLTVIRNAGAIDCIIPPPPTHCPPKAACNPPPPRHVDCPK